MAKKGMKKGKIGKKKREEIAAETWDYKVKGEIPEERLKEISGVKWNWETKKGKPVPCKKPEDPGCWSSADVDHYHDKYRDVDVIVYRINVDVPFKEGDVVKIVKAWMREDLEYTDECIEKVFDTEIKISSVHYKDQFIEVLLFGGSFCDELVEIK